MLKKIYPFFLFILLAGCGKDRTVELTPSSREALSTIELLSIKLLNTAYSQADPEIILRELAELNPTQVAGQLNNDAEKMSFWINLYNAQVQIQLRADTTLYDDRSRFFSERSIIIAGIPLSLDDIEHGVLRRSKNKYSLGYLPSLFSNKTSKQWQVDHLDWRIHFALNCGANSCPSIGFYRSDRINEQLNIATYRYLKRAVNVENEPIEIPRLFLWFRSDFGGTVGITKILQKFEGLEPSLIEDWEYAEYDWGLNLNQWYPPGALINAPQIE